MQSLTISPSTTQVQSHSFAIREIKEIQKRLNNIGLNFAQNELGELNQGQKISLKFLEISKLGSMFILASAIAAINIGTTRKPITLKDLSKPSPDSSSCSGILIYQWNSEFYGKRSLYLTILEGYPAIYLDNEENYNSVTN